MISVEEARRALLGLIEPLEAEDVPLLGACGRALASDVQAMRDQPPFAASAMDGYAVRSQDATPGASLKIVGQSVAGKAFFGTASRGEAVRILTGAPVPEGADRVVIQEDVRREDSVITLGSTLDPGPYIRPRGTDFHAGACLPAHQTLTPYHIALLAAMGLAQVPVVRRPRVAIIATGDELAMPGDPNPGDDQIYCSNSFGLAALLEQTGARAHVLPIASDTVAALTHCLSLARNADLIITTGGASAGDHDLFARKPTEIGLERSFYKVAMRPGKPLMAGHISGVPMVGLPGNPVSAMVCAQVFVQPMLRRMQGLSPCADQPQNAPLARDLPPNASPRAHYMRATLKDGKLSAATRQDSALLSVLSSANALIIRPPHAAAAREGDPVPYMPLT